MCYTANAEEREDTDLFSPEEKASLSGSLSFYQEEDETPPPTPVSSTAKSAAKHDQLVAELFEDDSFSLFRQSYREWRQRHGGSYQ